MSFVVKKRDLTDPTQLQALIVEHADGLEPGLTILDSRLLLGQASIDIVALDAEGGLVLIAVGLVADEEMLLKAVDAYSWCLEYPEAIRRLYPTAQNSAARPPRVMFVVERMPDAFHRKIKQLGFFEVDCVEFRHLDVDGTPAVYFHSLAQLRRGVFPAAAAPEQNGVPAAPPGRPTSLKLQKLLGADRPAPAREPAAIVRIVPRAAPRPEPKPVTSGPRTERVTPRPEADHQVTARPRSAAEAPAAPARVPTAAPVAETTRPRSSSWDVAPVAVSEAVVSVPELAQDAPAADAMLEPFVVAERPAPNGRVEAHATPLRELAREDSPIVPIVAPPAAPPVAVELVAAKPAPPTVEPHEVESPIVADVAPVDSEPDIVAATLSVQEARFDIAPVLELESGPLETAAAAITPPAVAPVDARVSEPEPMTVSTSVESIEPVVIEREPAVASLIAEPVAPIAALEIGPLTLESREPISIEPEPTVAQLSVDAAETFDEPEPVVAEASVGSPEPVLTVESAAAPEPVLTLESAAAPEPILTLESAAAPEPVVTQESVAAPEPVVRPAAPSVFSRRPAETVRKVSFAGMAKELLPNPTPPPAAETPISAPRASVEEITRAALDDLVGANDKRATEDRPTAFSKPSGAFAKSPGLKRPRTIAAAPSDGQPIAAGSKLAAAPRHIAAPVNGTDSAAAAAEGEPEAPAAVQGFEGLQFPNDGVLTRQWMEFLNQMAAGK